MRRFLFNASSEIPASICQHVTLLSSVIGHSYSSNGRSQWQLSDCGH
jgi:hypothetical protein